jgi:pyruvoyl-dependent arginine decarboxylase
MMGANMQRRTAMTMKQAKFGSRALLFAIIIAFLWAAPVAAGSAAGVSGKLDNGASPLVLGNRIPAKYFVTSGSGETDIGPGQDPWETGSYDLALLQAHIANFNVVPYTSVLPPESQEVSLNEAEKYFHHGAVVEVIMADQNGVQGDTLTTGVGRIYVRDKKSKTSIGGFAAEYEKVYKSKKVAEGEAVAEAQKMLKVSLVGEFSRRYDPNKYEYYGITYKTNYQYVAKKYGTSLTALAWVTYIFPHYSK